jgi:hypothetical protein
MADEDGRAPRSAAWGVVAGVFGGGAVATWLAAATPGSKFPIFPTYGFGAAAAVGLYMCFATLHGWWPTNRQRHRQDPLWEDFPRTRPLGVGLGALIPDLQEPEGPLQVTLEQEHWDDWQHVAWITELKFRITNTSGQPIRLADFSLTSDPGDGDSPLLDQAHVNAIRHEIQRRRGAHVPLYLRCMDLDDGDSVSGWWVQEMYPPLPARAGRPRCVFTVTDGLGDTHELEIPERAPKAHRLPSRTAQL